MPIISAELMKAIDERELQKTTKEKKTKTEKSKENRISLINYFKTKTIIFPMQCRCLKT